MRDEIQSAIYELEKERGISREYIVTAIKEAFEAAYQQQYQNCLLYTSPSPRD